MTQKHKITVRKPKFDFSGIPKHWIAGNAVATHLANSFFTTFPEGERFFVRSVRAFADQVQDEALKEEVKAFIGQEVQHGMAHEKHFDILREQGFNVDTLLTMHDKLGFKVIEPLLERIFGKKILLAATAAAEHYTATGAENIFDDDKTQGIHPVMRQMMRWHAAEEIEHKHVAFDVLKAVDDSYLLRIGGHLIATVTLYGFGIAGAVILLAQDEDVTIGRIIEDIRKIGEFRNSLSPEEQGTRNPFKTFTSYLPRDFHPNDIKNRDVAEAYFASDRYQEDVNLMNAV